MKTEEGNQLIMDFCEMVVVKEDGYRPDYPEYHLEINGQQYNLFYEGSGLHWSFQTPPPFHKDWRWLMPVVEKIHNLEDFDDVEADKHTMLFHVNIFGSIDLVWNEVVKFLQWYNSNK